MERIMFVSQIKEGCEETAVSLLRNRAAVVASPHAKAVGVFREFTVYRFERLLLVYAEHDGNCSKEEGLWNAEMENLLEPWPGTVQQRYTFRLNDIFHDDEPSDDVPWRRLGYVPERRIGSLARLKPEHYASYVFLHYQLQEERPRSFNKYYIIGSFGQYIFSYQELPAQKEPSRKGKLSTNHTPEDWQSAMLPHFELWTDTGKEQEIWRELELIISMEGKA